MPRKNIKPKMFSFKGLDGKTYRLSHKEKKFCLCYLELFGNGVEAVRKAGYDTKNRAVASAIAYENLRKPHIFEFVGLKLSEYGFSDENIMKHHLFLINQFADLKSKSKAIDMYYKLKGEYSAKKLEIVDQYEDFTDEEIEEELKKREEDLIKRLEEEGRVKRLK